MALLSLLGLMPATPLGLMPATPQASSLPAKALSIPRLLMLVSNCRTPYLAEHTDEPSHGTAE